MNDETEKVDNTANSRENEHALLGAVMRDGTIYPNAREIVKSSDFAWNCYGWVWDACEALYSHKMSIDVVTVGDELERIGKLDEFQTDSKGHEGEVRWNGRAALSKIRESGDPRNFISYAANVQDYSIKRRILQSLNKGATWAMNGRRGKDIIADIVQEFGRFEIYGAQDEYTVPISVGASETYDWTDRAARGEIVGVPTGFTKLDKLLGSMIAGNVYLLAGRPKKGKTGVLITIARNVAKRGKRVGIMSLEMSRLQVAQRLISQESEIDLHDIIMGTLEDREWPMFTHAVEVVADYPIMINDLSDINISQIRQIARKLKAEGGLDLLIVDYIQLAGSEGDKKYERRDLEVSAVSRGLKYLARELNIPVLAAAQLSRAVEQRTDKRPILSDLRESGSLEQDAYAVMFIHRSDESEKDDEEKNVAEIILSAHRNGPVGTVKLALRPQLVKFENLAADEFEENSWQKRADMGDD